MADGRPGLSLAEVNIASHHARFALLAQSGWFLARDRVAAAGVRRETVTDHAEVLWGHGLLQRREVRGASRKAYEWRRTPRGRRVHDAICALIERTPEVSPYDADAIALVAITADETDIVPVLTAAAAGAVTEVSGYLIDVRKSDAPPR